MLSRLPVLSGDGEMQHQYCAMRECLGTNLAGLQTFDGQRLQGQQRIL